MPMPGPAPKPNARRTNAPVVEWTEVLDVPFSGAPRLPRCRPAGKSWPTRTKAWWKALSTMPHCIRWTDSDWSFAIDTAILAADFHDGVITAATELRQREKIMGTTADARRALRVRYLTLDASAPDDGAADEPVAPVTQLEDYRDLYGE